MNKHFTPTSSYAAGRTFKSHIRFRRASYSPLRTRAVFRTGICTFSSSGVRHGALSPSSIVLKPDGSPAVLHCAFPSYTAIGGVARAYDAPETAVGGGGGAPFAADAWSLGAMMIELLTGEFLSVWEAALSARGRQPSQRVGGNPLWYCLIEIMSWANRF
eukprot:223516-Pleurochrysis_carterae.AAC.1